MLRTMMLLTMMPGKIHRATATQADLHYRVVATGDDPAEVVPGMAAGDLLMRGDAPAMAAVAR